MGPKQSKAYHPVPLTKQNWVQTDGGQNYLTPKGNFGHFKRYRNNLINDQIQQYTVMFSNQEERDRYIESFEWRQHQQNIVNTKYMNNDNVEKLCSTTYGAKVYIESIPMRLSGIEDIPYPENLYVLQASLEGFQKLYKNVGYFTVSEDLICIDRDGKVKVWFNPDLSKHYIGNMPFNDSKDNGMMENQMVNQIIELIHKNTDTDTQPNEAFIDYISSKRRHLSFAQCISAISTYAQSQSTQIPNYFESIMDIINENHHDNLSDDDYQHNHNKRSHEQTRGKLGDGPVQIHYPQRQITGSFADGYHQKRAAAPRKSQDGDSSYNRAQNRSILNAHMRDNQTGSFASQTQPYRESQPFLLSPHGNTHGNIISQPGNIISHSGNIISNPHPQVQYPSQLNFQSNLDLNKSRSQQITFIPISAPNSHPATIAASSAAPLPSLFMSNAAIPHKNIIKTGASSFTIRFNPNRSLVTPSFALNDRLPTINQRNSIQTNQRTSQFNQNQSQINQTKTTLSPNKAQNTQNQELRLSKLQQMQSLQYQQGGDLPILTRDEYQQTSKKESLSSKNQQVQSSFSKKPSSKKQQAQSLDSVQLRARAQIQTITLTQQYGLNPVLMQEWGSTDKIVYSDSTQDHELDQQIANDLLKYLKSE